MMPNFEAHKSRWQIRVAIHEIVRIVMMLDAIGREPSASSVVWLVRLSPTRRSWIVRDRSVTSWITADAEHTDPVFALPLPELFIRQVFDIAQEEHGVDLFCNEVDGTIVARSNDRYISVDEPRGLVFSARDLPYRDSSSSRRTQPTVATVQVADLHTFSNMIQNAPRRLVYEEDVAPFVSVAIGNGMFAFTSDWRRHGLGRLTGSVPAQTTGSITTQFYPYAVARLLRVQDPSDEASIYVGGDDAEHLYFAGDDWGIRILQDDEITGRWYHRVTSQLSQNDCFVAQHSTESLPRHMSITSNGIDCVGRFVVRDDVREVFQVWATLKSRVEPSIDVYDLINSLNNELYGCQVVIREGTLVVVGECVLDDEALPSHTVHAVVRGVQKCAEMDALLPLFTAML